MKKRAVIKVYSLVQGVCFRESTKQTAQALNLVGTVENKSDGSVCIEAEGSEEALKELITWCHQGPTQARVDLVDYEFFPDLKNYQAFEVKF